MKWKSLQEINCIHCDTRTFHAKCNIIDFKKIENDRYYELTYNKLIDFLEEKKVILMKIFD